MWSSYYDYYEIRSSGSYELPFATSEGMKMLDALPEVKRVGLMTYGNADGFPWIDLVLANGQKGNFHCSDETWHEEFNMIPIVCSKTENGKVPVSQIRFLISLAKALNWELLHEENDGGQESIVLWKTR